MAQHNQASKVKFTNPVVTGDGTFVTAQAGNEGRLPVEDEPSKK